MHQQGLALVGDPVGGKVGIHQRHIIAMTKFGQAVQQLRRQKGRDVFKHD
jgi:ribosomal protein L34